MEAITLSIVGCGAVTELCHLPAAAKVEEVQVTLLVDKNQPRAEELALQYNVRHVAEDYTQVWDKADAAIVALPHYLHVPVSIDLLSHGVHVLVEKPMALSGTECNAMIAAAEEGKVVLAVGHFRRFFPSCRIIKSVLDIGLLGPVRSFCFLEGETYSWPAQTASFFKQADAGGGVLIDAGAHTIDLLLWWLGDVAEVLYQDDAMGGVEANCRMCLKMISGAEGIMQLSRDWPLPNRYVIECEKGWIAYVCDVVDRVEWGLYDSDYGLNAEIRMMAAPTQTTMRELGPAVPGFMDYFTAQLRNLVAAICGIEPLCVPGTEAHKSVALIEKCYSNRKLLEMPWLDEAEIRRAQELANA